MPTSDFAPLDISPTKYLSSRHQMQHLFLQGVRSLLQFVPGHVKGYQVKGIIHCMLEVINFVSNGFGICALICLLTWIVPPTSLNMNSYFNLLFLVVHEGCAIRDHSHG